MANGGERPCGRPRAVAFKHWGSHPARAPKAEKKKQNIYWGEQYQTCGDSKETGASFFIRLPLAARYTKKHLQMVSKRKSKPTQSARAAEEVEKYQRHSHMHVIQHAPIQRLVNEILQDLGYGEFQIAAKAVNILRSVSESVLAMDFRLANTLREELQSTTVLSLETFRAAANLNHRKHEGLISEAAVYSLTQNGFACSKSVPDASAI